MLCRMLTETGVAGRPASYVHVPDVARWSASLGLPTGETDLRVILRAVLAAGSQGTGPFGLRLMRKSFDFLVDRLRPLFPDAATERALFAAAFNNPVYVHLSRMDKVAQAVSLAKAEQTGLWHLAADGREIERTAPDRPLVYDAAVIAAHLAALQRDDAAWRAWFVAEGITPLRLTYEDLAASPLSGLERVLEFLGLEASLAAGLSPGTAPLADATSHDWVARFKARCDQPKGL